MLGSVQRGWRNAVGATRLAERGWRNAVGGSSPPVATNSLCAAKCGEPSKIREPPAIFAKQKTREAPLPIHLTLPKSLGLDTSSLSDKPKWVSSKLAL